MAEWCSWLSHLSNNIRKELQSTKGPQIEPGFSQLYLDIDQLKKFLWTPIVGFDIFLSFLFFGVEVSVVDIEIEENLYAFPCLIGID